MRWCEGKVKKNIGKKLKQRKGIRTTNFVMSSFEAKS